MTLHKNEIINLKITALTSEGSGIGRYDTMAVFVANAAVGDSLKIRIIKLSKKYAVGIIEEIIEPSPDRISSDCPKSNQCGGCAFRHISYEAELQAKQQRVQDSIERIGGFSSLNTERIIGAASPDRYRNKAQYPVRMGKNGVQIGFFAPRSHRIVECGDCLLQPPEFFDIMDVFAKWIQQNGIQPYDETTHEGVIRHLYLRKAKKTGEIMVCIVINGHNLNHTEQLCNWIRQRVSSVTSIMINENREKTNVILGKNYRTLWGKDSINDVLCGLDFKISPRSFYQVNRSQAEVLYAIAKKYAGLTGNETVLDLYCGTGTIGLSMARDAKQVIGVEIIPEAIQDAKQNAIRNNIHNARFICADTQEAAVGLKKEGIQPDVVILDPPRKGCSPEVIHTVAEMEPKRVVYVSCDPATLARDMKLFGQSGYEPEKVTPVDMFPRTVHVETAVLFQQKYQ